MRYGRSFERCHGEGRVEKRNAGLRPPRGSSARLIFLPTRISWAFLTPTSHLYSSTLLTFIHCIILFFFFSPEFLWLTLRHVKITPLHGYTLSNDFITFFAIIYCVKIFFGNLPFYIFKFVEAAEFSPLRLVVFFCTKWLSLHQRILFLWWNITVVFWNSVPARYSRALLNYPQWPLIWLVLPPLTHATGWLPDVYSVAFVLCTLDIPLSLNMKLHLTSLYKNTKSACNKGGAPAKNRKTKPSNRVYNIAFWKRR